MEDQHTPETPDYRLIVMKYRNAIVNTEGTDLLDMSCRDAFTDEEWPLVHAAFEEAEQLRTAH